MRDLVQNSSPAFMDLLSPELAAKLKNISNVVAYSDGQLIHSRGDPKPGLSIVRNGAIKVGIFGIDGSFIATSIVGPGQSFGEFTLFAGLPRTHDVSAVGHTEIDQISAKSFKVLFDAEPELARTMLIISLTRTHHLLELLDDMRRLSLPVRAAKFLHSMSQSANDTDALTCRQSDLAFTLGVSRISLGKALRQLADQGLIVLGYGKILLPDTQKLSAWVTDHSLIMPLTVKI